MNFDFSDDQKSLKDEVRKALAESAGPAAFRKTMAQEGAKMDCDLWRMAGELGWLGAAIPEEFGGSGLGHLELCVIAEELGRHLAAIPFSSSIACFAEGVLRHGAPAQKAALLPGLASGALIRCYAVSEGPGPVAPEAVRASFDGATLTGEKIPVADGAVATHALVLAREGQGLSLVIADLATAQRTPVETLDPSRDHARIRFNNTPAERLGAAGEGWELAEALMDRAAALLAFEQVGGAQQCLNDAVAYAKDRQAFGRPIGSFQAIKHKLADVYVALEVARAHAYFAAWALSADAPELPLAAAQARVAACEAYHLAAKESIQTHGGMGFTWDVDCHLYYRRAKLLAVQAGAPGVWREKLVRRLELRNAA